MNRQRFWERICRIVASATMGMATVFAVSSCATDSTLDERPAGGKAPVGFAGIASVTRASVTNTSSLSSMGVFGYYTAGSTWAAAGATAKPDYFYNQPVAKSSGTWSYSPEKYWPVSPNKLTFFAYAPHSSDASVAGNISVSASTATGAPTLSYTVEDDVADQVDLLYASAKDEVSRTTDLRFSFDHALTRVSFSAALAAGEGAKNYTATVKKLEIINVLNSGTMNLETGVWTVGASKQSYEITTAQGINTTGGNNIFETSEAGDFNARPLMTTDGYMFLMPQTLGADAQMRITVNFNGGDLNEDVTAEFDLDELLIDGTAKWNTSQGVDYRFTINGKYITATVITWSDGGQGSTAVEGQNFLTISDRDFQMSKWAKGDTRFTVTTNLASWSASVTTGGGDTGWLRLNNAAGGTVTGVSGGAVSFEVDEFPTPVGSREGIITITAGRMSLGVKVTQTSNDQEFMLRLSHSELVFPARKYTDPDNSDAYTTPDPQSISVTYGPTSRNYEMALSPYVGGGVQGFTPDADSDAAEIQVALSTILPDNPKVVEDPFFERSSRLGFTVYNQDASDEIIKQVLIKQVNYAAQVIGTRDYYFQGDTYTFSIKANTAWVAEFENEDTVFENISGTLGSGKVSGAGEILKFTVKASAAVDQVSVISIKSPTGLFPTQYFEVNVQNKIPNCYIVAPTGAYVDIPVRKAYRTWALDRDLQQTLPAGTPGAKLVWQDAQSLIQNNITFTPGSTPEEGTIRITANSSGIAGNAVVAFTIDNVIYWSWHIWVTSYDPETTHIVNGQYRLMDRNLGAMANSPGSGTNAEIWDTYGLYYQYGKKDPIPHWNGTASGGFTNSMQTLYNINNQVLAYGSADGVKGAQSPTGIPESNLGNSIKNPDVIYDGSYGEYSWYGAFIPMRNDFWSDTATDYDPCPGGWKIAHRFAYMRNGGTTPYGAAPLDKGGFTIERLGYFPASGYVSTTLGYGGVGVYYYGFYIHHTGYNGMFVSPTCSLSLSNNSITYGSTPTARSAQGFSTRCMKQ